MTIKFQDVIDLARSIALASKVSPTEESVWRSMCRSYSTKFATPLHLVMELDPEFVLIHHYESQFDELDDLEEIIESFLDVVYGLEDPEYEKAKKDNDDEFAEEVEQQELLRVAKVKAKAEALKKTASEEPKAPDSNLPQSGGINLSYLASEESES